MLSIQFCKYTYLVLTYWQTRQSSFYTLCILISIKVWYVIYLLWHLNQKLKHDSFYFECTLSVTHSRSIVILWYDFKSFWHGKKHPKSSTTTLSSWLLADTYQGFPKRYHNSILVMGFQSCKLIKFEIFDLFESPMLTRVFSRAPLDKM